MAVRDVKIELIHKTRSTKYTAVLLEENLTTAIVNKHGRFGEVWTCGYLRYAGEHTDKQTDRLTDCNTLHLYQSRVITHQQVQHRLSFTVPQP